MSKLKPIGFSALRGLMASAQLAPWRRALLLLMVGAMGSTAGDCNHSNDAALDVQPPDDRHASVTVFSASQFPGLGWDGHLSVARFQSHQRFGELNIDLSFNNSTSAQTPPSPTVYFSGHPGCTMFFDRQIDSNDACGTKFMMEEYAYKYRNANGITDTTVNKGVIFTVDPHENEAGVILLGITRRVTQGTPPLYLYTASWIFKNEFDPGQMLQWGIPNDQVAFYDGRLLSMVMPHELGHLLCGFGDADYDSTQDPQNLKHNMSGSPRCLMAAIVRRNYFGVNDIDDPNYPLKFCTDSDGDNTNSCWDNRFQCIQP